jgi:hypothetical protein
LKLFLEWEWIKENGGGGKFKYDIVNIIVRTFVNATMYPYLAQHKIK